MFLKMSTSQCKVAGYFHIFESALKYHLTDETLKIFLSKKLEIAYKLTFLINKPLDSVLFWLNIYFVCKFYCRDDNKTKNNEVISWNNQKSRENAGDFMNLW